MKPKHKMVITSLLRNTFIAHRGNNYRPHLLKPLSLAAILTTVVLIQLYFNYVGNRRWQVLGYAAQINEQAVVEAVNFERQQQGQPNLQIDPKLQAAARAKAGDMIERHYWDHYGPDGTPPWSFIDRQGYIYAVAGENLARDFDTSSGAVAGWMTSQSHRQNLLNPNYQDIGVAIINTGGQQPSPLVVALFAQPASLAPANPELIKEVFAASSSQIRFSLTNVLSPLATLTWAAKVTGGLLGILVLTYMGQHIVIRCKHLAWDKRLHRHPLFLAAMLLAAILVIIVSSYGVIL
ncbi:CAP domain-containing protein [Candidatus Microgenomates bacterium]|nr:CAP domain-containing protein [Candidatus Microgenomates bacterium]